MNAHDEGALAGTPDCARFQQMALDRRYDELDRAGGAALGRHLDRCSTCSAAEAEWTRVTTLLNVPEVARALAGSMAARSPTQGSALLPAVLGGLTASVSLLPILTHSSHPTAGPAMLGVTAIVWTIAYQTLFAGLLAEHRRQRLPLPIDIRTVLLGLLASEGTLIFAAAALLGSPVLGHGLAAAIQLSLPELLTSLSGSILLAVGAFIGFRGQARPVVNALGVAILHGLLLLPGEMLIDRFSLQLGESLAALVFLAGCAAVGAALGAMGAATERSRAVAQNWQVA